jgi:hypothetical protein
MAGSKPGHDGAVRSAQKNPAVPDAIIPRFQRTGVCAVDPANEFISESNELQQELYKCNSSK